MRRAIDCDRSRETKEKRGRRLGSRGAKSTVSRKNIRWLFCQISFLLLPCDRHALLELLCLPFSSLLPCKLQGRNSTLRPSCLGAMVLALCAVSASARAPVATPTIRHPCARPLPCPTQAFARRARLVPRSAASFRTTRAKGSRPFTKRRAQSAARCLGSAPISTIFTAKNRSQPTRIVISSAQSAMMRHNSLGIQLPPCLFRKFK